MNYQCKRIFSSWNCPAWPTGPSWISWRKEVFWWDCRFPIRNWSLTNSHAFDVETLSIIIDILLWTELGFFVLRFIYLRVDSLNPISTQQNRDGLWYELMAKLKRLYLEFVYKMKKTKNSTYVPFQVMPVNNVGRLFEFSTVHNLICSVRKFNSTPFCSVQLAVAFSNKSAQNSRVLTV